MAGGFSVLRSSKCCFKGLATLWKTKILEDHSKDMKFGRAVGDENCLITEISALAVFQASCVVSK